MNREERILRAKVIAACADLEDAAYHEGQDIQSALDKYARDIEAAKQWWNRTKPRTA